MFPADFGVLVRGTELGHQLGHVDAETIRSAVAHTLEQRLMNWQGCSCRSCRQHNKCCRLYEAHSRASQEPGLTTRTTGAIRRKSSRTREIVAVFLACNVG